MQRAPSGWLEPPPALALETAQVHVWHAHLDQPSTIRARLQRFLHADEQAHIACLKFEHDRHQALGARGLLRVLLGRYLALDPAAITLVYGPQGKPALGGQHQPNDVHFNVSHSAGRALFAFTLGREVGVDIEQVRTLDDIEQVATQFFSAREAAVLLGLPPEERAQAFFACWTRKEAFIKGLGSGLSHPLDTFDVSLAPGEPARLLAVRGDAGALRRWSLHDLPAIPGYAAALAVAGQESAICCWQASPADLMRGV